MHFAKKINAEHFIQHHQTSVAWYIANFTKHFLYYSNTIVLFRWLWIWIIILVYNIDTTDSSHGDRDMMFQGCVHKCMESKNRTLEWYLVALMWNKDNNCKYKCMHRVSRRRKRMKLPILQYFGKWPFKRFYGIEDPASFVFSLLNLFGNIYGWILYKNIICKYSEFFYLTKVQFLTNANGWIFACIFHARDLYWTEKLDYFGAALVIAISILTCFTRIIGRINDKRTYFLTSIVVMLFGYHISYMAFVKFDYGYNMKFMICVGAMNVLSWLIWCWVNRNKRKHVWKCAVTMLGTGLFALLELLDFPPIWWLFDGHSLWHLGTAPLSILWFQFLIDDDSYIIEKKEMKFL